MNTRTTEEELARQIVSVDPDSATEKALRTTRRI